MRVADWIVGRLAAAGVRHIFLLPGGGAMHLNDALAMEKRIEPIACHHEQACAIAAEAYGRTGYPSNPGYGVAMVTTGPGATNAVTAVAGAWLDSIPLLLISGQVKRSDRVAGRGIRQGGVQEVEVIPMIRGITKYCATVEEPEEIFEILEKALAVMREGRPGPVWIEVPLDVQGAPVRERDRSGDVASTKFEIPVDQLSRVAARLSLASRPLVLAGHGVRLSGAANEFRALCERWQVPVVTTWNAMDLLPFEHELYVGRPGTVALRAPNFAVQNADFLLAVGCRLDNVVTAYDPSGFAPNAYKVMIDVDQCELSRAASFTSEQILCDARAAITHWLSGPSTQSTGRNAWTDCCRSWKRRFTTNDGLQISRADGISHYELVEALSEEIPENSPIATGSSGLAIEAFYSVFRNKDGQRIFLTSGLGSMGYGLPAAIGACLGCERRATILIESDGSLMLNIQELATLSGLKLPIRIVIVDNQGYASIRNTQRNYFQSRYIATGQNSGLNIPEIEGIARAFGISATTVNASVDLRPALRRLFSSEGPAALVVKVLQDETLQPKVAALPQADGSMMSMPLEDMSPLLPLDELQREMLNPVSSASIIARRINKH